MAEAAAANGIAKKIIPANVAQYTADAAQNPVRFPSYSLTSVRVLLAFGCGVQYN
jgi:hypothetical protein